MNFVPVHYVQVGANQKQQAVYLKEDVDLSIEQIKLYLERASWFTGNIELKEALRIVDEFFVITKHVLKVYWYCGSCGQTVHEGKCKKVKG